MADISKITLPNGDAYDIKDATARGGQKIYYATCTTAAATAAKVATTTNGDFVLETGAMVRVKFSNADTYNGTSTLNVDSKGAKNIIRVGTTVKARYNWHPGEVVDFVYDGSYFVMSEGGIATTSYYGITSLSSSTSSTSEILAATPKAVKAAYDLAASKTDNIGTITGVSVNGTSIATSDVADITLGSAAFVDTESTLTNDSNLPTGAAVMNAINNAVDFGTVGSNQNPVYFDSGEPTPIAFTFGVDTDQNVQVAWDGDAPTIVIPTTSALAIDSGGTGATTEVEARTNLGLGSAATYSVVSAVQDDDNLVTNGAIYRYVNAATAFTAGDGLELNNKEFSLSTSGVTAGSAGPTAEVTGTDGTTIAVPRITVDEHGRVTDLTSYNLTNKNTENTAGSTDTSSKIFLIGATSQAANPQTYSDNEVYATNGVLTTKAVQVGGTSATMQFNSTTNAIDFIFA